MNQRSVSRGARRRRPSVWTLGGLLVAACVAAPLLAVAYLAVVGSGEPGLWSHLAATVLPDYAATSLQLMLGVAVGALILGVTCAWLIAQCRFPGRQVLAWALLLPLAMPAYVLAYVYTDALEYAGPVQTWLRAQFGWRSPQDYWFPEIRSLGGAVAMLSLTLYPYVYLLARTAFQEQSACLIDAGRTLGLSPWQSFLRIALPMARPAIVVGLALVLMETLNDFGTVDFFAVPTFTLGIYDVWHNMNSSAGAAQIALVLLGLIVLLIVLERRGRHDQRYHALTTRRRFTQAYCLSRRQTMLAWFACLTPVLLGFLLPAVVLGGYALRFYPLTLQHGYWTIAGNSLTLAAASALAAVAIGLFLAYGMRLSSSGLFRSAARVAGVGYAIPGAVLAVGVMIPLAALDNAMDALSESMLGFNTGLLLSGTLVAVAYGYVIRFLALPLGAVEAGLGRIKPSMDDAARTLGIRPGKRLARIHFPLLRGSLLAAMLLVFVDGMKELPMTVALRPFNYDTLATFVYQYASDEMLEESAFAALSIVAVGILPVMMLSRAISADRTRRESSG